MEDWKSDRGPLFWVDLPGVLEGMKRDSTLATWLVRASCTNTETLLSEPGDKFVKNNAGLWSSTAEEETKELIRMEKMQQVFARHTNAGNFLRAYFMQFLEPGDPQEDPQGRTLLALPNMRKNEFVRTPFIKKGRAKDRNLLALFWLLACADQDGLTWDIEPPRVGKHLSVFKMLAEKLDVAERQARRYIDRFVDSRIIERVEDPPHIFDENRRVVQRFRFRKQFVCEWLRLPMDMEDEPYYEDD